MNHQNYLYLEYRRAIRKFRKLQTRFEKRVAKDTFQDLTARKRYLLLTQLRKLKQKIEQLTNRLKLAAAGGSLAFTMGLALSGHEAEAQVLGVPKVLTIDKTLANDDETDAQQNPDVALNNEGNFAIVWEEQDGSLKGKGYGGDVDQSVDFSIPGGTSTFNANPSIAINDDDQFVVAWADSNFAIKYMRYEVEDGDITSDGPYIAKDYVSGEWIDNPEVAMNNDGNFVITWEEYNGTDYDIKARYYTSENVSDGVLDVSQNDNYDQTQPSIDMDGNGNFVVTWLDRGGSETTYSVISGRKYYENTPDDNEFSLIQGTDYDQEKIQSPDVDLNGDGSFVLAWEYEDLVGSFEYIRARIFDTDGIASSGVVDVTTLSYANDLHIAADKDGGFIVVYEDSTEGDYNVLGKRFNRFGDAIQESDFTFYSAGYEGGNPAVGMNDNGDFVVAWNDEYAASSGMCYEGDDCDDMGVYFKKYSNPENEPYGIVDESQVNDYSTGYQHQPAVDVDINGNFVVVWQGESATDGSGIIGQQYHADGTKNGSEFQINTTTDNTQSSPDVAIDGSGHFIVTWSGYAGTSKQGIFAQMYNSDGSPDGSEFQVDQETSSYYSLSEPSVDINHDGDAVIVWEGDGGSEINARVVTGANEFDGNEFMVNASTFSGARNYPDVAIQDDDSFVVTWGSWVSGGEDQTFIRRFDSNASALDADDVRISSNYNTQTRRQSIAMDKASGDFMVAFTEYAVSYSSILASKYKSDGTAVFEEEELTNYASTSDAPDVSANLQGEFAVVWRQIEGGDPYLAMSLFNEDDELVYEGFEAINPENYSSQGGVAVALDLDGDAIGVIGAYYGGGYNVYTKTIAPPLAGNVGDGNEFIVNSITSDNQVSPDVAQNAGGDFVVVWKDGYSGNEIKAQRYNNQGVRQGVEIIVNNDNSTSSRYPSVALNDEGNFMVAWQFYNGATGGEDVMGSVIKWDGEVVEDDFIINSDDTDGKQAYPDITLDENGDFRVIWSSTISSDYDYSAIATKKFSPTGVAESAETTFLTDDVTNVTDYRGSIAINSDGDIAVSYTYGYDGYELYLNVFNKSLESQVEELQISNGSDIKWNKPAITSTDDGEFVVAWAEGSDYVYSYVRKYSSGAAFDDTAKKIEVGDRPNEVNIEAVDDGDFILTFRDEIDDSGDYDGIWAQRLSDEMEKIGPEFLVNDTTQNDHSNSAMASSPDGSYTVVWEAEYTDGSDYAVMAKQFVSHKPTIENEGLTIDEGAEADITADELLINNPSGGDESPLLTVTLLPSEGTLKLDGNAVTLNQELNEDDMFFLSYEHSGDEGTYDLFTFTVANEDFETSENTFYISVTPINDIPDLTANHGMELDEGDSQSLYESLSVTDPDNSSSEISYTLISVPEFGDLYRDEQTNALGVGDTFTQSEVGSGTISYQNDGSESATDGFEFTLSDLESTSETHQYDIEVNPVNDAPTLANAIDDQTGTVDDPFTFELAENVFEDVDGDELTLSAS
ncbi:MAG: cadherin-like domain-containing protein, partial [Reichenbachiella sp.]|uniref:cadherin-like domain-containing protein n=2 Tax=Reichenbachiella sp. TaxID=2184521 RepID=UPI00329A59AC